MGSDQHVKHWMAHGFPMISSLLLYFDVKQYMHIHILEKYIECRAPARHCVYFILAGVIGLYAGCCWDWLLQLLNLSTTNDNTNGNFKPRGFLLTSSLLMDYQQTYEYTQAYIHLLKLNRVVKALIYHNQSAPYLMVVIFVNCQDFFL